MIGKSVETDRYGEDTTAGAEDKSNDEYHADEFSANRAPNNTCHIDNRVAFWMIVAEISGYDSSV